MAVVRSVVWGPDGLWVDKRHHRRSLPWFGRRHDAWEVEWRVGSLLRRQPPPVRHARLLAVDRRSGLLRFEAVPGSPIGPKFPLSLADGDAADLAALALAMPSYRPTGAGFVRRFDLERRLRTAVHEGALTAELAARFRRLAADDPPVVVFGHGDITARNVLRSSATGEAVLIDWEWTGRYPRGWDLAFLWFTLVDAPGARDEVEALVPARDEAWFWRSALLVQVLHLMLWGLRPGTPFRAKHERMRDELIERVLP
jgi:hypothetical protein